MSLYVYRDKLDTQYMLTSVYKATFYVIYKLKYKFGVFYFYRSAYSEFLLGVNRSSFTVSALMKTFLS